MFGWSGESRKKENWNIYRLAAAEFANSQLLPVNSWPQCVSKVCEIDYCIENAQKMVRFANKTKAKKLNKYSNCGKKGSH